MACVMTEVTIYNAKTIDYCTISSSRTGSPYNRVYTKLMLLMLLLISVCPSAPFALFCLTFSVQPEGGFTALTSRQLGWRTLLGGSARHTRGRFD